jgi:hypothetical protein
MGEIMTNRKKPIPILILLAVVAVSALIIGVVAYMFRQSPKIENTFIPAIVTCSVKETFENNKKTSVTVENTGDIEVYIRLRVVAYWQDSKGNVVAKTSPTLKFDGEWGYNSNAWIYDKESQTFYHKKPVAVGNSTEELIPASKSITLEPVSTTDDNGITFTYNPVITFVAEAIQSLPNDADGAVSKWGVTLDANGNIVSID